MHKQIQISPGVYVTDFRQNKQLKGIDTENKTYTKDVGLTLDKINTNESKIKQLLYSIQAIKEDEDWENDDVFLEAVWQNYGLVLKFSQEMKEFILDLNQLQYKPENDTIQKLIDPNRISERESEVQAQYNAFKQKYAQKLKKQQRTSQNQQAAEVSDQQQNNEKQLKKEETPKQDQGVYL